MTGYRSMQFRTLLLYAQDARGLGHITRTLNIARHVLAAQPDAVAFIATRSNFAHHSTLPERCDYIKLPSRQTPKTVERTPEDDEASKAHFRQLRGQILLDAALGLAPDLVLVDHEPLGASGEFARGLWALKEQCPDTRFVFGLRDIMDDVERIRAEWRQYGVYEALEHLYDGIAVYGSPRLLDVAEAYAIPEHVRRKLHYCGYIVRDPPTVDPCEVRGRHGVPENVPFVLATVGSGSDGFPVLEAAQAAVARLQERHPDLHALLVTGPFMPPEEQAALQARATATCRVVSYADNFQLMTAADAIVSMGGYNSVCEALVAARPLVIVPRATHKVEQRIRAETLAAHGLARWVHPREMNNGHPLSEALEWALSCDRQAHARLVREVFPSFDGVAQLTAYLSRWLAAD
ncbi:MAG TPA: glycosyltransferase [Gemmatimonadales bacterium]|nr:glycosyltransferase [Gemmatimonadales bacterium]